MKGFTKIALILSLVLVILGSMFCMIGLGIGFNFSEFWEEVENAEYSIGPLGSLPVVFHGNQLNWRDDGESWNSSDTEQFAFSCQGKDEEHKVERLDLDVYYGTVNIEKQEHADEIQVVVEYRKQNHRRKVEAYKDGTALMIKETGGKRSIHNDSTRITIRIPASMNEVFKEISLKQDAGDIFVNMPLTAEEININVNAGECQAEERLKALRVLKAEVGAGEIELEEAEAELVSVLLPDHQAVALAVGVDVVGLAQLHGLGPAGHIGQGGDGHIVFPGGHAAEHRGELQGDNLQLHAKALGNAPGQLDVAADYLLPCRLGGVDKLIGGEIGLGGNLQVAPFLDGLQAVFRAGIGGGVDGASREHRQGQGGGQNNCHTLFHYHYLLFMSHQNV